MKLVLLFLFTLAMAANAQMSMTNKFKLSMQRRRKKGVVGRNKLTCETKTVLLTSDDITAGQFSELTGAPAPFDRQGGVIQLSDPTNSTNKIGDYSFLITFLDDKFGCIANGAYTFGADQVTFTASCSGLPFFSITGGRGKFDGAEGFVEFMIPADNGFTHDINICRFKNKKKMI